MNRLDFVPYFLTLQLLLVGLLVVALAWLSWRYRRQKAVQDQLVEAVHGQRFWRVIVTREAHLKSAFFMPATQTRAVLVDAGDRLELRGRWASGGERFDLDISRGAADLRWAGTVGLQRQAWWLRLRTPIGELMIGPDHGWAPQGPRVREAALDLLRTLAPERMPGEAETRDFALERHPRTVAVMVLMTVLALYALLDTFVFSRYELIESQLVSPLLDAGLAVRVFGGASVALGLVGGAAWFWLRGGRVPVLESGVLAAMLTAAVAGAALPVLKRIDQSLASEPSKDYAYRLAGGAHEVRPVDASLGLPVLRFRRGREYWSQFPADAEVSVPLLRGPSGLWQLDHARFDPPIRAYYEARRSAGR